MLHQLIMANNIKSMVKNTQELVNSGQNWSTDYDKKCPELCGLRLQAPDLQTGSQSFKSTSGTGFLCSDNNINKGPIYHLH